MNEPEPNPETPASPTNPMNKSEIRVPKSEIRPKLEPENSSPQANGSDESIPETAQPNCPIPTPAEAPPAHPLPETSSDTSSQTLSTPPPVSDLNENSPDALTSKPPCPDKASAEGALAMAVVPGANPSGTTPLEGHAKPEVIQISPVLGVVTVLSDAEQIEFYACEDVLETASSTFVQAGLAFARIRDLRLYRMEYQSFENYCQSKWQYTRRYVDFQIAAAQLFNQLRTISSHQQPAHETQLRPLIGLTPDQALSAWESASAKAGPRKITARLVKSALKELQAPAPEAAEAPKPRSSKHAQRRLIDDAIGQLLLLLSQKASHDILTQKVDALHGYFQALFPKTTKR